MLLVDGHRPLAGRWIWKLTTTTITMVMKMALIDLKRFTGNDCHLSRVDVSNEDSADDSDDGRNAEKRRRRRGSDAESDF